MAVPMTMQEDGDAGDNGESNNNTAAARAWHLLLSELKGWTDRIVLVLRVLRYHGMPESMSRWKAGNNLTGTLGTWSDGGKGRVEWLV
jgi:hypothetical protein